MRSKIGRKGGIKSGEVKKERKKFKQTMEMLLSLDIKDEKLKNTLKSFGIDDSEMNNQTLLIVGLYKAAMNGNVNAYKEIQTMMENTINYLAQLWPHCISIFPSLLHA